MIFSKLIDIPCPAAFNLFFFPEDVRVGTRFFNMLRNGCNVRNFEHFLEALTFNQFAKTFTVFAFFHPPVPKVLKDFLDLVIGILAGDERDEQGAHLGAVQDRGLGAAEDRGAVADDRRRGRRRAAAGDGGGHGGVRAAALEEADPRLRALDAAGEARRAERARDRVAALNLLA